MKSISSLTSYTYTRDRKVKDKFGYGDLENWDTVTNIIWGLGIPKIDLDTKYD